MTGFLLQGLTARTLAAKLVEVGEAHSVMQELRKLLPNASGELTISIDATAVQEAIDKEMKSIGIYGEIDRVPMLPSGRNQSIIDRIEGAHRVCFHAQFDRKTAPESYRNALLQLAALTVGAIKLFDAEREDEQRG